MVYGVHCHVFSHLIDQTKCLGGRKSVRQTENVDAVGPNLRHQIPTSVFSLT